LPDIAHFLRIKPVHLAALEAGDLAACLDSHTPWAFCASMPLILGSTATGWQGC
jgi:hypothetical protein